MGTGAFAATKERMDAASEVRKASASHGGAPYPFAGCTQRVVDDEGIDFEGPGGNGGGDDGGDGDGDDEVGDGDAAVDASEGGDDEDGDGDDEDEDGDDEDGGGDEDDDEDGDEDEDGDGDEDVDASKDVDHGVENVDGDDDAFWFSVRLGSHMPVDTIQAAPDVSFFRTRIVSAWIAMCGATHENTSWSLWWSTGGTGRGNTCFASPVAQWSASRRAISGILSAGTPSTMAHTTEPTAWPTLMLADSSSFLSVRGGTVVHAALLSSPPRALPRTASATAM
jgi:hypothetical protein